MNNNPDQHSTAINLSNWSCRPLTAGYSSADVPHLDALSIQIPVYPQRRGPGEIKHLHANTKSWKEATLPQVNKIFASFTILVRVKLRSVKVWSIKGKQGPLSELPDMARQAGLRPVAAGDDQDSKYGCQF